jgi:hypothetical protein
MAIYHLIGYLYCLDNADAYFSHVHINSCLYTQMKWAFDRSKHILIPSWSIEVLLNMMGYCT